MLKTKRKATVILLGVIGLLGMAGSLMAYFTVYHLPAPRDSDREQLVRWLATRDLRYESQYIRGELISRLQDELDAGVDLASIDEQIDERSETQLRQNLEVLMRQWFLELSGEYWQTRAANRNALLDSQLGRLQKWRLAEYMTAESPRIAAARQNPMQAFGELTNMLHSWADSAPPAQRERAHEFVTVVQTRVAWLAIDAWRNGKQ